MNPLSLDAVRAKLADVLAEFATVQRASAATSPSQH